MAFPFSVIRLGTFPPTLPSLLLRLPLKLLIRKLGLHAKPGVHNRLWHARTSYVAARTQQEDTSISKVGLDVAVSHNVIYEDETHHKAKKKTDEGRHQQRYIADIHGRIIVN